MDKKMMELIITRIKSETPEIKTFRLDLGPHKSFSFLPGQFIIVRAELWNAAKGKRIPVNRAFSISSSPQETDYIEFTAKRYQDGRMTHWLYDEVQVGQTLFIKGPSGHFVFREGEADELVLIAGGIGIAPFRSIIRDVLGRQYPVKISLFYSARTPVDFAYKNEFDDLAERFPQFQPSYTVTRDSQNWTGQVGRIDLSLLRNHLGHPGTRYYLCGPQTLIDSLSRDLESAGIRKDNIMSEAW
ncbi:MAG: hypothetical protein HZA19_02160 [Nitrospirae bacterium]|nr:hypothetical protein [Nitrospirota bacterium]